ncbi:VOC family protein [Amycolatopsis benzoatilytica]|uniref:VOC family protein n=1 Tax=Amycolatopsis benzoatilytica TaxID=346045 RepID=UPI000373A501|nr:VOC family protein [Amycolatopsis benzoatilytica]
MALRRMDNVLLVVEDLDAVIAFFVELGMELENRGPLDWRGAERVIGLEDVRQTVAMLRVPDGPGRVELAQFQQPKAIVPQPAKAPANTVGLRRMMFAVDDLDDTLDRLRAHGAELVGTVENYENVFRLCYLRGPEGIVVGLAEELS